jgi:UrcA family protein
MTNSISKTLKLAAISLLALGIGNSIQAADVKPETIEIDASAYNLASPDGVALLRAKVRQAAKQVCFTNGVSDALEQMAQSACFKKTMANGHAQISEMQQRKGLAPVVTASR